VLPARFRLTRERDFDACYRRGRRAVDRLLTIACLARPAGGVRIGVSVSRKVGSSVVRNRVKRWIREAARPLTTRAGEPFDLVISARPAAAQSGFYAVRESIAKLMGRLQAARSPGKRGEPRE
jgi:ribonuclease P protein component